MNIAKLYKSGYRIERPTTINSNGVASISYSTVDNVEGRMRPLSADEIFSAEKMEYKATNRFYCGIVDINEKDRIIDTNNNLTYEVKRIIDPMDMQLFLQIDCELRR